MPAQHTSRVVHEFDAVAHEGYHSPLSNGEQLVGAPHFLVSRFARIYGCDLQGI